VKGGILYGVIRTDKWIEEHFHSPIKICQQLKSKFNDDNPEKIYKYLLDFGMYKPNRKTYATFKKMKKVNIWEKVERLFEKYQQKWKGPNVHIYIFPIASTSSLFTNKQNVKSGIAFHDKLFLFLSPLVDETELEALFIHEYHHVCRLNRQKKSFEEFTLLDSLVMEGLAEYAVETYCGPQYRAKWCTNYSRKEIFYYWKRYIKKKLQIKKTEKTHDEILYGSRNFPKLLGYSVGYEIVSIYNEDNNLSIKQSFLLPAERFVLKES